MRLYGRIGIFDVSQDLLTTAVEQSATIGFSDATRGACNQAHARLALECGKDPRPEANGLKM